MMNEANCEHTEFETKIKSTLDGSVEDIDIETCKRLAIIRRQALQQQASRFTPARWLTLDYLGVYWLPVAVVATLAIFVVIQLKTSSHVPINPDQVAMFEVLNNADDIEIMSDPDFYLWANEVLLDETN